jgi:hypothetical protein
MSRRNNDSEKDEGSKFSDKAQLDTLITGLKNRYDGLIIKEALKSLPPPPEPAGLDDLGELKRILEGFAKAFGLPLLYRELKRHGFEQPKETREILLGGGGTFYRDQLQGFEIGGPLDIAEDKTNGSHGEMEITMLGAGFLRLIFKGGNKVTDDFYDINMKERDKVSISELSLTVKHVGEQSPVSGETYAPTTSLTY